MPSSPAIAQDPELIAEFITEAAEHLAAVETQVLALERDPTALDPLHAAFRSFHTIKGLAGFLDLAGIREVSHEVETLLDRARNRDLTLGAPLIDVILESADYLKRAIQAVDSNLKGIPRPEPENAAVLGHLRTALAAKDIPAPEAPPVTPPPAAVETAHDFGSTLRVDAARLDHMIDLVGELVLAQSLVSHDAQLRSLGNGTLRQRLEQLGHITGEVQRMGMALRMTPVGQLFGRMRRLVRDLARKNGKSVRVDTSGDETELDKSVIEAIVDPLMHMIRNSLDHGIETAEERIAKGKPAEGRVLLTASHERGQILLQVSDDGCGLDNEKILARARQCGLATEDQSLSEAEIFQLIFLPGFSTARQVTEVSGRGVGMDVVRRQVEGLRGTIETHSVWNAGTTFFLRLPLTLAIVDGLIVGVGAERYILPVSHVREILQPRREMLFNPAPQVEMAMIRGELLPILRLGRRFAIPGAAEDPCRSLLVVTECEGRQGCLQVDQLLGKQEVVIKSLGAFFRNVAGISGGAILGDGRLGLILDLKGLLEEARHV